MYNLYNKTQADMNLEEQLKDAVALAYQRGFHAGFQAGVNKPAEKIEQHAAQGYRTGGGY